MSAVDINLKPFTATRWRYRIGCPLWSLLFFCLIAWVPVAVHAAQDGDASTTQELSTEQGSIQQGSIQQGSTQQGSTEQGSRTSVGYVGRIDGLVLPGSILAAQPIVDREQPVVVRVIETYPHGDHFRYDLEFIGYEPGEYNLADYLIRADGTDSANLPAIPIQVFAQLPAGQILPSELKPQPSRLMNLYTATLVVVGILWVLGLWAILFWGRFRLGRPSESKRVLTVADRLRPLVLSAQKGQLDHAQQAELERLITAHWRNKLRLEHLPPAQLVPFLRGHQEAGELLVAVETWLHNPNHVKPTDIDRLLAPFADSAAAEED